MLGAGVATLAALLAIGTLISYQLSTRLRQELAALHLPQRAALEQALLRSLAARLADEARAGAPPDQRGSSADQLAQAAAALHMQADSPAAVALAADLEALIQISRRSPPDPLRIDAALAEVGAGIQAYAEALSQGGATLTGQLGGRGPMGAYMIAATMATAGALAGLVYALGRALPRPLSSLTAALAAVRAGDLSYELEGPIPTELAPVAAAYQRMAQTLRQRQSALDDQLRRTSLLTQLSIELREATEPAAIVERVLRLLGFIPGVDEARVVLVSPDGHAEAGYHCRAGMVCPLEEGRAGLLIGQGVEGWALRHRSSTVIGDTALSERWRAGGGPGSGSAVVLPVRQGEAVLGTLTVYAARPDAFAGRDLLLLEGVASQVGVALSAARRYQELRLGHDQAVALLKLSQYLNGERSYADLSALIEAQSQAIFRAAHGIIYLCPHGTTDRPLPLGELPPGLDPLTRGRAAEAAASACASQQIVTVGGPGGDEISCVALPLAHAGGLIGACVLLRVAGEPTLPANLWSLLTVFTNSLAAALANIHLVEQLRQHAGQLERLIDQRTEELRRSRDLLRIIFDNLPEGLMLFDSEGQILAANNAFCRGIVGCLPQSLVGRGYAEIWSELARKPELQLEPQGPREGQQSSIVPAPGRPPSMRADSWRVLGTDLVGQQRWYAVDRIPVPGEGAQCLERWSDITQQEELQRRLLLHEQLNSLGRLAASVAHEVGNPLQSALGCLELCREDADLSERAREYLGLALGELDRMARTMESLRHLYRPPQISWERVDLNQILTQVLQFTRRQMSGAGVRLELDLEAGLPLIEAQPDALRQVFLNLLLNAQQAMPGGGRLRLSSRRKPTDRVCEVVLHDTGVGMSQEQLAHLFEPFRSGKAQGVGLGLYLSRRIIEQHAGHIAFSSQLGVGTTVTVLLPWSDDRPARAALTAEAAQGAA